MLVWIVAVSCAACGKRERAHPPGDHPPAAIRARVDRRVETLAILCWLAGLDEYNDGFPTPYRTALAPLERLRDHAAVVATRELHARAGIGYNAPVSLAVYLDDELNPRVAWNPPPAGLDARWKDVDLDAYLAQVRAFVRDAKLAEVFAGQRGYFTSVEQSYQGFLDANPLVPWFDATLGPRNATDYVLVPGMLTDGRNYGARTVIDDRQTLYQVVMLRELDDRRVPHPDLDALSLLTHELAHSYVNPVFETRYPEVEAVARPVYERVADAMAAQAYTDAKTMVDETLVRALTILFLQREFPRTSRSQAANDRRRSFLWIDGVVRELDRTLAANGRLTEDDLVEAARAGLSAWLTAHPR